MDSTIAVFVNALHGLIKETDNQNSTRFHAVTPPDIDILSYLSRLVEYANVEEEELIIALIYIDRVLTINRKFKLSKLTIHRIILLSVHTAIKFYRDQYISNAYMAKLGGIPSTELTELELDFLYMIHFNLKINPSIYETYRKVVDAQRSKIENVITDSV